jgi:hypothetical protein
VRSLDKVVVESDDQKKDHWLEKLKRGTPSLKHFFQKMGPRNKDYSDARALSPNSAINLGNRRSVG